MDNTKSDVLAIFWWDNDGVRHYRSRGIGEKYAELYRWIWKTSYRCTSEDFPWDYWVFDNPSDHDAMCALFGDDVIHDKESEQWYIK